MPLPTMRRPDLHAPITLMIIALLGILVLWLVFQISFAGVYRASNPELALRVAPRDSRALSDVAADAVLKLEDSTGRAAARVKALEALRGDLTNVTALRTLGLLADADGDRKAALRMLTQAEKISRRDLPTQLWLIEYFSQTDNVAETLRHYDIALSTATQSRETLLPILTGASSDPTVAAAIRAVISKKPVWRDDYVNQLVTSGPVEGAVAVLRGVLDPRDVSERAYLSTLLVRLTTAGKHDVAWQLYVEAAGRTGRKVEGQLVRNGGFETAGDLAPFDWAFEEESDLAATRAARADGQGNALFLSAAHEKAGMVATQLIHLAPGAYRAFFDMGGVPDRPSDRPNLSLICTTVQGSPSLTTITPEKASEAAIRVSGDFRVGAECPWQLLVVRVNSGSGETGIQPWIDNISITRSGQ